MRELSSDLTRFLSTTRGPFHYGINYIASPHTHADQEVREARLLAARVVTGDLIEKGIAAFSPIVYSRALAETAATRRRWTAGTSSTCTSWPWPRG